MLFSLLLAVIPLPAFTPKEIESDLQGEYIWFDSGHLKINGPVEVKILKTKIQEDENNEKNPECLIDVKISHEASIEGITVIVTGYLRLHYSRLETDNGDLWYFREAQVLHLKTIRPKSKKP